MSRKRFRFWGGRPSDEIAIEPPGPAAPSKINPEPPYRFNFDLGNHRSRGLESLRDLTLAFAGSVEELGHKADISYRSYDPGAINVLIEGFSDKFMDAFRPIARDVPYGIVCTEQLEDGRFHNRSFRRREHVANLIELAKGARFIWGFDEACREQYAELIPNRRAFCIPFGYSSRIVDFEPVPDAEMQWDVAFMGPLTPYRERILDSLRRAGLSVHASGEFLPAYIRSSVLARSRVHVALRIDEGWRYSSPNRIAYLLANGCCVVSEACEVTYEIDDYCVRAQAEDLIEACAKLLASGAYREVARDQRERFRDEQPMTKRMAEVIECSLG